MHHHGYIGYDDGRSLVDKIRKKPYSVVLFDEVEKANVDVLNILLQILEDGKLTDANGVSASFQETLVILTSNIGADILNGKKSIGFKSQEYNSNHEDVLNELKNFFKPELLNRIDEIEIFNHLTEEDMHVIFRNQLKEFQDIMKEKNIVIKVSESLENYIIKKSNYFYYGARTIRREIEQSIEDTIVNEMIMNNIKDNYNFKLDYNEEKGIYVIK